MQEQLTRFWRSTLLEIDHAKQSSIDSVLEVRVSGGRRGEEFDPAKFYEHVERSYHIKVDTWVKLKKLDTNLYLVNVPRESLKREIVAAASSAKKERARRRCDDRMFVESIQDYMTPMRRRIVQKLYQKNVCFNP